MGGDMTKREERDERFAQLVAEGDRTLTEAWLLSSGDEVRPENTPGRRVSASRAGKRCAERIAQLKRERATSQAPQEAETLTAGRLQLLMADVTAVLMDAANAAQQAGSTGIAQQLRKTITVHSGRTSRLSDRTPAPEQKSAEIDREGILSRLYACRCSVVT